MIENNLKRLFRSLDIENSNGLVTDISDAVSGYQKQFYTIVKQKMDVSAVFFLQVNGETPNVPVVYFSLLEAYDGDKLAELHKMAWNLGEAPLLFVVTPDQLFIFNNYKRPRLKDNKIDYRAAMIKELSFADDLTKALEQFSRINLESGEYWRKNQQRFRIDERIDSYLLSNLRTARDEMLKTSNNINVVHTLLSRSILIKYFEDRKDFNGESALSKAFFSMFLQNANCFTDILEDVDATYRLFEFFDNKFHGDIFRVSATEYSCIEEKTLRVLADFLRGNIDLKGDGQYYLWPLYRFDLIPIQLISTIYEMLFQYETENNKKKKEGTFYTPYHLVELLADEVFPWDGEYDENLKVLDPACGSGIFLVEIFRRLISRWMVFHRTDTIAPNELCDLLIRHVYGVDKNEDAIKIACFSLGLVLCDYLEPLSIWEEVEFPSLINNNLFVNDFFDDKADFNKWKYDLIIGNPPWESHLTELACSYLRKSNHSVGDNQISQAFSWKVAEMINEVGWACLIMPSKGFLFNISLTNQQYRRTFFRENDVVTILNLTEYKGQLFKNAKAPATAIIYHHHRKERGKEYILYCTPKPTYTIEDKRVFIIEPLDICKLPLDMIDIPYIWKTCMFGGLRDIELIEKIKFRKCTLDTFAERNGLIIAEGVKKGNRKNRYPEYIGWPLVDVRKDIHPFYIDEDNLNRIEDSSFERFAVNNKEIFEAPHLLIRQSVDSKNLRITTAILNSNAVFTHSILGMHGDSNKLKFISLLLSSSLFSFYAFMTSGRWIIERSELEAKEFKQFPVPEYSPELDNIIEEKYNDIIYSDNTFKKLDDFVFGLYGLRGYERVHVLDTIEYLLGYNVSSKRKRIIKPSDELDLKEYAQTLIAILQNTVGRDISIGSYIYHGEAPLCVAAFYFKESDDIRFINEDSQLESILENLDSRLLEQYAQGLYVRRSMTIFESESFYVVKPNQKRYWNYVSASRDADDIYAQIVRAWRANQ